MLTPLDRSTRETEFNDRLGKVEELKIIRLASNLGHQRAIAVGLVSTFKNSKYDAVVVMDSDGEDRPSDFAKLLAHWDLHPTRIIVARRARRLESFFFDASTFSTRCYSGH
jgi:polyisoprenyl-phosphate glycosyltransferase